MFGWIIGLFDLNPLVSGALLAVYGAIFGAVLGALVGLAAYSLTGGRRDFTSISGLSADSYDLLVDDTPRRTRQPAAGCLPQLIRDRSVLRSPGGRSTTLPEGRFTELKAQPGDLFVSAAAG
jgi:hypothetical protein